MEVVFAVTIGALFAAAFYLMLRRSWVRLILGMLLFGQAVNLLVFAAGGIVRGAPPLIPEGGSLPPQPYADPLPQAFILTAIVIGFGVVAFAIVLARRAHEELGEEDLDRVREDLP